MATPWLTISGGRWPEYFFNGVPFHAVLPDPDRDGWYSLHEAPHVLRTDEDAAEPRTPSMTVGRIRRDLPELVEAAELLTNRRLSYEDALQSHFSRMLERSRGRALVDVVYRRHPQAVRVNGLWVESDSLRRDWVEATGLLEWREASTASWSW